MKGADMGERKQSSEQQRQRLAYEAARIMAEQGIPEFDRARRKAAERARICDKRCWPDNEQIQEALLQHRRLFQGGKREEDLRQLRSQALEGMHTFARFAPRLVGPVLIGTGGNAQGVRLHLYADNPEEVILALIDQGIPWQGCEETLRFAGGVCRSHPGFTFIAGNTPFELVVLPRGAVRNPPLDPVSNRPERGADVAEVERLLDEPTAPLAG